jgi:hypothetical protein
MMLRMPIVTSAPSTAIRQFSGWMNVFLKSDIRFEQSVQRVWIASIGLSRDFDWNSVAEVQPNALQK